MLHVLTFEKAKDEAGREITIDPETAKYTTGITRCGGGLGCVKRILAEFVPALSPSSYRMNNRANQSLPRLPAMPDIEEHQVPT